MSRDAEFEEEKHRQRFGQEMHRQKAERWRKALADYGFAHEIVAGYDAVAALETARRYASGRGVTPIIFPPGNWNTVKIGVDERCRKARAELDAEPPTIELGKARLESELERWHGQELHSGAVVDMGLFERLPAAIAKPQEANPWLLTDHVYPEMERVMWDEVAIVEIPTPHHWEVPVYLDWGNWNGVPRSTILAAVARYWDDQYGARVIAAGRDQLEFSVERKPKTFREAARVFREHFLFGPDPVELKDAVLAQYAADLMLAETWVFWWD